MPPFTTAEITFVPGVIACSVPSATPSASVGAEGWVRTLPRPVAARVTVAPGTGSPRLSRTVTRMTERPVTASMLSGDAVTEDCSALGCGTSSTAVAVKFTRLSPAPTTSACTCCSPRPSPSTHCAEASPSSSVNAVSGVISPPLRSRGRV